MILNILSSGKVITQLEQLELILPLHNLKAQYYVLFT
jgi:hypothetical protein